MLISKDLSVESNPQSEFFKNKNITVTGGAGFLGSHLVNRLVEGGAQSISVPRSNDCDLRVFENCLQVCKNKDIVLHLAADVGGIGYNQNHPYDLVYNNLMISTNMVHAALLSGVKKFIGVGTICEYPKITPVPFREDYLWSGYPEETNAPYGMAKKMLLVLTESANKQFGLNALHLLPVNLYGPGDNFNPESSHVIPALIKKFVDAKIENTPSVTVWGTGNATREFLYIEDAAEAIVLATQYYNKPEPVNIGAGFEISIKNLVEKIRTIVGYEGKIVWDTTKPDGQPRRMLDTSKAEREFGFRAKVNFDPGLKKTIEWYLGYLSPLS